MGRRPPGWADDENPTTPKHGWQYWATQPVNAQFMISLCRCSEVPFSHEVLRDDRFVWNGHHSLHQMQLKFPPKN